jgi:hypothetical protein
MTEIDAKKVRHVEELMRRAEVTPDQTIVIGDAEEDLRIGKEARAKSGFVSWGHNFLPEHVIEEADVVIENPSDIRDVVDRQIGAASGLGRKIAEVDAKGKPAPDADAPDVLPPQTGKIAASVDDAAEGASEAVAASRKIGRFGKLGGFIGPAIGGSIAAAATYFSGGTPAQAAMQAGEGAVDATPAGAVKEAGKGRFAEAALRLTEEIPIAGFVAAELARPVLQAAGGDVDAEIGVTINPGSKPTGVEARASDIAAFNKAEARYNNRHGTHEDPGGQSDPESPRNALAEEIVSNFLGCVREGQGLNSCLEEAVPGNIPNAKGNIRQR